MLYDLLQYMLQSVLYQLTYFKILKITSYVSTTIFILKIFAYNFDNS